ncbi:hypothetical protein JTE90_007069 [Oedothorax gibbosus]|uniref:Ribosomal protein L2 n=1 Tax=Oedothorax gibbosus TaxID=931172 RepID=A0AAV6TKE3_9ARAC|nr:hypothetical protein JTE90_007069 [Oedothorax gibbosus]
MPPAIRRVSSNDTRQLPGNQSFWFRGKYGSKLKKGIGRRVITIMGLAVQLTQRSEPYQAGHGRGLTD